MEDADAQELGTWAPRLVEKLKQLPALRDVASDQQNSGLQANLVIDRDTASSLGITPQTIDDTCTTRSASARSPPCSRN